MLQKYGHKSCTQSNFDLPYKHTYRTSATRNWIMYDSNLTMSILFILNTNSHHTLAVLSSRIGRFMNVLYIAPSAFCPQLITTSNHQTAQFTLWC